MDELLKRVGECEKNFFTKKSMFLNDSKWDYETKFQPRESFSFYHKNNFIYPVKCPKAINGEKGDIQMRKNLCLSTGVNL